MKSKKIARLPKVNILFRESSFVTSKVSQFSVEQQIRKQAW